MTKHHNTSKVHINSEHFNGQSVGQASVLSTKVNNKGSISQQHGTAGLRAVNNNVDFTYFGQRMTR